MEPKKDRLEEYFRKSLESLGEKPSPGGWDLPSDEVWKGIEEGILPVPLIAKQAAYLNYLVYLALVLVISIALWQLSMYKGATEKYEDIVEKQEQVIAALENELQNSNLEEMRLKENSEAGTSAQDIIKPGEQNDDEIGKPSEGKISNLPPPSDKQELMRPSSLKGGNLITTDEGSNIAPAHLSQVPVTVSKTGRQDWTKTLLETRLLPLSIPQAVPALNYVMDLPLARSYKAMQPISLSAYLSPAYSYRSVYHKVEDTSTPYEKTESPKISYTAGISLGLPAGRKFGIVSGVNYNYFQQSSVHTIGMRYTVVGAKNDASGNLVNRYRANLETSFGQVEVETRVANDSRSKSIDLNEGRIFPVRFETDLELQHLSVPLLVQYRLGSEQIGVMLKGGVAGTFLLDKNLEIGNVRTLNERLLHINTDVLSNRILSNAKSLSLDMYFATGMYIGLSQHLDFTLEPSFRKNITPVFENEKLETRMFSIALHTGLTWKF